MPLGLAAVCGSTESITDRLPEWECGERCEAEAVTWAADTTARATMQMVNIAMLNRAHREAVHAQMEAVRGVHEAAVAGNGQELCTHEDALTQVAHCGPCRFGQK